VLSTERLDLQTGAPPHLLELMARGKTIVVTGMKGTIDVTRDDDTGLTSSPATIDGLIEALDPIARDQTLRARLGDRSRSWVAAHRSTEQAASTLRTIYRTLPVPDRLPPLTRPESHDERLWWKLLRPLERKRQAGILDYTWRGKILDLGTRNGIIAAQIALTQAPEFIVGIDPDAAALVDARQIVASNQITSSAVEFVVAIGEDLPFADRTFDGVIVTQVLEHVEHPEIVLKEVVRVLKPSGSVLVGVPGYGIMPPGTTVGHVQDFTVAAMTQLIEDSGLELVEQRTVDVREYHFARLPDGGQSS
jgi:SAM-dependent methyltransferase